MSQSFRTRVFPVPLLLLLSSTHHHVPKPHDLAGKRIIRVSVFLQARQALVHSVIREMPTWRRIREVKGPWRVAWIDSADATFYRQMRSPQRVNQLPGMEALSRKKNLARHLNAMREKFPDEYDIYPRTWVLPEQFMQFKEQFTEKRNKTFIIKPDARCQGRGIFLTRNIEDIDENENQVAQRYMHKPFLIDGLKFDLRLYVLLASVDPLRLYLHRDGLVRFCTEKYRSPLSSNLDDTFSHLTNYSINKNNDNFVHNVAVEDTSSGSKWTYQALEKWLVGHDHDVSNLWESISDTIVKTFLSASPVLRHNYRLTFPTNDDGAMCYQLLGVDIMLDRKLNPYLLEVNRNPSLRCDTPLDTTIKQTALREAFHIVCAGTAPNRSQSGIMSRLSSPTSFREWKNSQKSRQEVSSAKRQRIEAKRASTTSYVRLFPCKKTNPTKHAEYERILEYGQDKFDNRFRTKTRSYEGPTTIDGDEELAKALASISIPDKALF